MQNENGKMDRRDFMKSSALAAAGAVAAVSTTASAAEVKEVDRIKENKFKVIDFRCRPPLKSFGGLFKMRIGMFEKRPNVLANPATFGKVPPSVQAFAEGRKEAMDLWWKEIDACGIESVVVAGRFMKGQPEMSMDTAELLDYEKKYKDRFYGIAPINIDQPIEKALEKLEKDLQGPIRGCTIEPGYRIEGGPTTIDNPDFFPLYELIQKSGKFLQVQTGAFANPMNWNEPNEIWRMDNVMRQFPKLKLILGHGGYPRITEALALALKWPSVTLSADVYTFWPGGQLYQQNIEMLQDQFVYGSAYPFGNFKETLEQALALPLSDAVFEKYLYHNSRKLLGLES
jgi:predicted TIM-barrel fold metal-dependent hydrolase